VIVENTELLPLVPFAAPVEVPEPPAPTVTVYEVPATTVKDVSAEAPPPEDSPVTDDR
jgi:hypothetical protein